MVQQPCVGRHTLLRLFHHRSGNATRRAVSSMSRSTQPLQVAKRAGASPDHPADFLQVWHPSPWTLHVLRKVVFMFQPTEMQCSSSADHPALLCFPRCAHATFSIVRCLVLRCATTLTVFCFCLFCYVRLVPLRIFSQKMQFSSRSLLWSKEVRSGVARARRLQGAVD